MLIQTQNIQVVSGKEERKAIWKAPFSEKEIITINIVLLLFNPTQSWMKKTCLSTLSTIQVKKKKVFAVCGLLL